MEFKRSDRIDGLVEECWETAKDPSQITEEAETSCTCGYDNDGSTGYEIFQNGFNLGCQAASEGKDVFVAFTDWDRQRVAFFFLGTEEEIVAKLEALDNRSGYAEPEDGDGEDDQADEDD